MIGIALYCIFLIIGFLYADMYFKDRDLYFRIFSGGIFGNLALMAGIIPFGFIFGFTHLSHILLLIAFAVPCAYLMWRRKNVKTSLLKIGRMTEDAPINHLIFCTLILPVTALICVLMANHIMAPYSGGAIASGQSTYGDLAMHMGFVTSIAEQRQFPPEYNVLAGYNLNYPFLIDSLSSSLYLFGTGLRAAILLPSYIFALLLVMGFFYIAYTITGRRSVSVLATVFFFLCGGFGFAYFFEGAKADSTQFTKIFTEYYQTPTNLNEKNIRWSNTICDMIVPQRTTMAGWTVILFALWLLIEALREKKNSHFWLLGVVAGCMPMIHTHSFLDLGIISAVMFFLSFIKCEDKKENFLSWLRYGGVALVLALPQLFLWTFTQTSGGDGFLIPTFNWVNEKDPYLWFWLKNWGIIAIFTIPAALNVKKENRNLVIACAVLFLIAELVLFQPNPYDNNKLFYVVYMIAVIIVSDYLFVLYEKLSGVRGRAFLGALVIFFGTLSGILTIGREYKSGADFQTFSKAQIEFAEFVKENTDPHATFATADNHLNPVSVLAGRNIYAGSSLYVYFHGFGPELSKRKNVIKEIYTTSNVQNIKNIAQKNGIKYILVSHSEMQTYKVNPSVMNSFKKLYDKDGIQLYEVE